MTQNLNRFIAWWKKMANRWLAYQTDDPILARKGYYLSAITLGFALVSLLTIPAMMLSVGPANVWLSVYITPFGFLFLYYLTRRGLINLVGFITILAVGSFALNPNEQGLSISLAGFLILALVVILAGLLIGTRSMFIAALLSGILSGISLARDSNIAEAGLDLAKPFIIAFYLILAGLTYMLMQQVQAALTQSQDYATELEQHRDHLEEEVTERTAQLQNSFDLTSQVSSLVNTSPTLETLFQRTVGLIQTKFDFYHVHIYRYDQDNHNLQIVAGSGIIGQRLRRQEHAIAWGESVVGLAAQNNQPLVVNDVQTFPDYVYNPLLPDTRSEMAIPVSTGTQILAVLDIQNSRLNSFSQADQALMESLANQLAVAVNNINLITEAQQALQQVEALNAQLTEEQWSQTLQDTPVLGYLYTPETLAPTADDWLTSMTEAVAQAHRSGDEIVLREDQDTMTNEMAIPIKIRGQLIGVLGMQREADKGWNENDKLVVQALSEQIALALESARLFENAQRNAWRDQVVGEATARVWSTAEIEEVMRTAIEQLGQQLDASEVIIQLNDLTTTQAE